MVGNLLLGMVRVDSGHNGIAKIAFTILPIRKDGTNFKQQNVELNHC